MIGILKRTFSWWHQATWGTSFSMWQKKARLVGEDDQGNRYFEETGEGSYPEGGRRRWVIYHGHAEGSRVPPEWHGWLHHTWDEPPTEKALAVKKFETPYLPNMTGTPMAYHPSGSLFLSPKAEASTPSAKKDYEAWSPDSI
ncbi:MAG: NADH:ubiquinone oxidoreductase subunit NDUFA12 [Pseudomonadota bacterium]